MEDELLKIFDEDKNFVGVATREEIHKLGIGMRHLLLVYRE